MTTDDMNTDDITTDVPGQGMLWDDCAPQVTNWTNEPPESTTEATQAAERPLQDSGTRRQSDSGAERDRSSGKGRYDLLSPAAVFRLARVYEKGALKYTARNWERGMPQSWFMDSALRHLFKHLEGWTDEDHLAQAAWNIDAMIDQEERFNHGLLRQDLNDLPPGRLNRNLPLRFYVAGPFSATSDGERRHNREKAEIIGIKLMKMGHLAHVPHAATWQMDSVIPMKQILDLDFTLIRNWATALYVLGRSPGTDQEIKLAEELGLVIVWSLNEVPDLREKKGEHR